jgi:glycerol uptake facilitator-like aquaporin
VTSAPVLLWRRLLAEPAAVGACIGAAYWFTSSTSFANPAITIGRMFSDTFAGIAPSSVPPFIAAQILGGILAAGIIKALYPAITPADAAEIIVPHNAGRPPRTAHDGASQSADRRPGPASVTGN